MKEYFGGDYSAETYSKHLGELKTAVDNFRGKWSTMRKIFSDNKHAGGGTLGYWDPNTKNIYLSKTAYNLMMNGTSGTTLFHEIAHSVGYEHRAFTKYRERQIASGLPWDGGSDHAKANAGASNYTNPYAYDGLIKGI